MSAWRPHKPAFLNSTYNGVENHKFDPFLEGASSMTLQ